MKKVKSLFLTFILMFIGLCSVNAVEYSILVNAKTGSAGSSLEMSLQGINNEETYKNSYAYYVRFVNSNDSKPELTGHPEDSSEGTDKGINSYLSVNVFQDSKTQEYLNSVSIDDDWYLLEGYTKAYIVECKTTSSCEILENSIDVVRPELPKLGQRYQNYLFTQDKQLSIFPYFPFTGEVGSHELNVKVGLINDNDLLKQLSKNESGSLEKLLEYAKKSDGTIFTENDEKFLDFYIGDFKVINGSYYYMYTYYTNTDGKYRNLDDITVVMGDSDMLVNDVEWKNLNSTETIKNPDTGINYEYGILILIIIIGFIAYLFIRKHSKFIKHN